MDTGASCGSIFRSPDPSDSAHSRQPSPWTTQSPSASARSGRDHPADSPAGHRLAERERRHVRAHVVHPRPHVRVDREVRVADENLSVARLGDLDLGDLEEILVREAGRTGDQTDLAVTSPPCGDDMRVQSLKGHLLVAAPVLLDPNFRRTVVLVGEHGDEGALGVVLNRTSGSRVDEALPELAALIDGDGRRPRRRARAAVGDRRARRVRRAGAAPGRSCWTTIGFLPAEIDPEALGELRRTRVFAGYAGWGPGQLDGELEEGSWIVEPAAADDVFTTRSRRPLERRAPPQGRPVQRPGARCRPIRR